MKTLKRHLTVANVLSCIALFVALSATAVAATKLSAGQVKAVNIATGAVTNPKLKNLGVTSSKIANGTIVAGKLKNSAVTNAKLNKEAVTTTKIKKEAVTGGKLGPESVSAAKLSASLYAQLVRNVAYTSATSGENTEQTKSITANCPAGKQAIAGGVRLSGELANVAVTGSSPFSTGSLRTGWSAFAHETGAGPYGDWSIEAFAVCAEL